MRCAAPGGVIRDAGATHSTPGDPRFDAILQSAREGRRIELPKITAVDAFRGSRPG